MKKLIACILVFISLMICVTIAVSETNGTCGTHATWTLNDDGTLTISGSGEMSAYGTSDQPWKKQDVKKVVIEDGITSVGAYAFDGCTNLQAADLPSSIISIGKNVFSGCDSLAGIMIPGSVTSIGEFAFIACSGLASITIPDSVTSIESYAFSGCSGLTSITIPDSVTSIGDYVFRNCSGLTSITIPNSVTSIGADTFRGCSGLTSITIPDSVTSIGSGAFYGCTGLTSITIPGSVTSIGSSTIGGCSSLTSIMIPDSVTSIESYAFSGCSGLTSITIPDSVTSIGSSAFGGCSGLTSITIPDSVTSIGLYMFIDCSGLTSITIPDSVTNIGECAFYGCSNLTSVYYTGGRIKKESIVIDTYNDALEKAKWYYLEGDCGEGLTWTINNAKNLTISGSGDMDTFTQDLQPWYPSDFTAVTVLDGVTSLSDYAFYDAELTAIYLPDSVTTFGADIVSCKPTVYCNEYSYADYWAYSLDLPIVYLDSKPFEDYGSITVLEDKTLYRSEECDLEAVLFPDKADVTIIWTSSNQEVASVDEKGHVITHKKGIAEISANVGSLSASVTITVQGFGDIGELQIKNTPEKLGVGEDFLLCATAKPNDASLIYHWYSSDPNIIDVDENGLVTAISQGTATITVEADGIITTSDPILSYIPITSLVIPTEYWIVAKSNIQIKWQFEPVDASHAFSWDFDHSAHADVTVTEDGIVSCYLPGDITLTLTDSLTGLSAATTVHVCRPVTSIVMDSELTITGFPGKTHQFIASAVTADDSYENHLIEYSSDNESVAAITADGLLTIVSEGTVHITATAESGVSATCDVTIRSCDHSSLTKTEATEATCSSLGNIEYYTCDTCGIFLKLEDDQYVTIEKDSWITPAHPHTVVIEAIAPTCTESGRTEGLICTDCETVLLASTELSPLGHDIENHEAQAPTCTEIGWDAYDTCTRCNYSTYIEHEALDHDFEHGTVVEDVAAGCTEDGHKTVQCSRCDATDVTTYPAQGHSMPEEWTITKAATCEESGEKIRTCQRDGCGYTETETIEARGHSMPEEWTVTKAATCEESGEKTRSCQRDGCGYTETETIEAQDHSMPDEWTVTKAATCEESGEKTRICQRDGCGYTETETIEAQGHSMSGEWTVTRAATCEESGEKIRICQRDGCGYTETETIDAQGHSMPEEWTVTKAATCEESGEKTRICQRDGCGYTETETIEAQGHDFEHGTVISRVDATCEADGEEIVQCIRDGCAETQTTVLPKLNHDFVAFDHQDATLDKNGSDTVKCSHCEEIQTTEIPAGVAWGDIACVLKSDGTLTITGSGAMPDATSAKTPAPWASDEYIGLVKSVSIAKGITTIGKGAFSGCVNLTKVTVPTTVTTIGSKAFANCTALNSITLGTTVTSIASDAFAGHSDSLKITAKEGSAAAQFAQKQGIENPNVIRVTAVKLNKTSTTLYERKDTKNRDTLQLKLTVTPSNATNRKVTWKSSAPKVAKVDSKGLVTALTKGTATITATVKDGIKTWTKTCKITVGKVTKKITKITAKPTTLTLKKGKTGSVTLTFAPKTVYNNKVKWTTSDKTIATVSTAGVITAKKKGTCTITATATDGSGKKVTVKVTVK